MTWFADRLLARHAVEAGGEVALVEAGRTLTWTELDGLASSVAASLAGAGILPGERVALVGPSGAGDLAGLLGVLRAGAVAALVPGGLTARETASALAVLAPSLVLRVADVTPAVEPVEPPERDPEAPAVIVLTSGTTGDPKGVILSSRAMAASADAWTAALPPATGWAMPLGPAHVAGLGILWRAILARVPVRIVPPGDPLLLLAALHGTPAASHVSLVPAQLARALDEARGAPPPSLRAVLLGGGPIPPALVTRALRAGWPVVPTYGLSETASGATALATGEAWDRPGSAGRPLPGVNLAIADAGPDGVGEIVLRAPSRFSGYVTGDRGAGPIVPAPADEPVRTGDLGRIDAAGRLWVVDRRVDRIVRGGENVNPAEVEAVLEAHPAVAEAAVVGRPDPVLGHVPVAAVVLREGAADPGAPVLAAHARASLAGFKIPVAFVRLDELPRTGGGKLRRETVRALLAGERAGELARPGGDAIGWRVTGDGSRAIVLLHGTLSTAAQLDRLAAALAEPGDITVHALDRRGSGSSRLGTPRPLDVAVHVDDLVAYLDARGIDRADLVGVSFGGVLAIETAARRPERVRAVVAYEPPYGLLADEAGIRWFRRVAADTAAAHAERGPAAAAETFLRAVAGDAAWDRLPGRARAFLEGEGDGALADAGLTGLDPDGLGRITAPVTILTGGASDAFYAPLADALAARIPGARRGTLDGLAHTSPITQPGAVAPAVRACLEPTAVTADLPPDHTPSGASTGAGNAAAQPEVQVMFDRIAPRYDLMNLLISGFQEPRWRKRLVDHAGLRPGGSALDVASGTGKVAADLHARVQPFGRVLGVDLSPGMTAVAQDRYAGRQGLSYVVGDALDLPTEDASFDAATIAFGMRNLPDYRRGFAEMARSVRPGGKVLCLEIARPTSRLARFMRWWFDRIVPVIGRVAGQGAAYGYLVRSVQAYPAPERIAEIMGEAGLVDVTWQGLTGGIVTLHEGTVPER